MNIIQKSMELARLLRHKPLEYGVKLEKGGWASTEDVLNGLKIDMKVLNRIIEKDKKGRYSFNEDKTKCRANQGHSTDVDLGLEPITPPDVLYHGTVKMFIKKIEETGLKKMSRHHVHLSKDIVTAKSVAGRRKSKSILLEIDAKQMHEDGIDFFLSDNGVWLTDNVPVKYIKAL